LRAVAVTYGVVFELVLGDLVWVEVVLNKGEPLGDRGVVVVCPGRDFSFVLVSSGTLCIFVHSKQTGKRIAIPSFDLGTFGL
jgi:hypothetical protein